MNKSWAVADGLVLFGHGARDPRWAQSIEALVVRLRDLRSSLLVEAAYLEFIEPPLGTALESLVRRGADRIVVVPVFWSLGGHVARDLPTILESCRARHPAVTLSVLPVLSELPGIAEYLVATWAELIGISDEAGMLIEGRT